MCSSCRANRHAFWQQIDGLIEIEKSKGKTTGSLGTTKRGIGPTYSSKMDRTGFRVGDLYADWAGFCTRFRDFIAKHKLRHAVLEVDIEAVLASTKTLAERLKPMVTDTVPYIHERLGNKKLLVEGANATMLDIDFGTYPYVTSSSTTAGGVATGLGIPPKEVKHVYGVVKAYTTRVGAGGFPTEQLNKIGETMQEVGFEFGVTTGRRRRCGWLDLVVLKYSTLLNGFKSLMITKLDILDSFKEIKVAVAYTIGGETLKSFPAHISKLDELEVVYETLPGWSTPIVSEESFRHRGAFRAGTVPSRPRMSVVLESNGGGGEGRRRLGLAGRFLAPTLTSRHSLAGTLQVDIRTYDALPENAKKYLTFIEVRVNLYPTHAPCGSTHRCHRCPNRTVG